MAANEGLGDLLSQKYFLSKILVHLVDSGLHECRRVCRLWCEVCNQLPVKLSPDLNENAAAVSDIFPNAVSLEVGRAANVDDGFVETLLASCMSSLRNLRHLVLRRTVEWHLFLDKLEPNTESLQSLLSLSVRLTSQLNFFRFSGLLEVLDWLDCAEDYRRTHTWRSKFGSHHRDSKSKILDYQPSFPGKVEWTAGFRSFDTADKTRYPAGLLRYPLRHSPIASIILSLSE